MAKRLIINADDFGYTEGVNRAITQCARDGVLTSATIMARGAAFDDAVAQSSGLNVGCHVVLVDGHPASDARALPTLAPHGIFRRSLVHFVRDAVSGRISAEEIEREALAQITRVQETGIRVTHVDSHKHTHLFPPVLRAVLKAATRAGVDAVRNPCEPSWTLSIGDQFSAKHLKRSVEVRMLACFAPSFRNIVREFGMKTTDGSLGLITTGTLDDESLCRMIVRIPDGTWEMVSHPGYSDEDLARQNTRLRKEREIERRALISPKVKKVIADHLIQLVSYADL